MKYGKLTAFILAGILTVVSIPRCRFNTSIQTVGAASAVGTNPVISRDVPAYSNGGTAAHGNDLYYYTAWQADSPGYLAYDLSSVAEDQRRQVIAVCYNGGSYDNIGSYVSKGEEPVDYTIEVNASSGGSYPSENWVVAEEMRDNSLSSRQHLIDMRGYNWIRINVSKAQNGRVKLNLDVHDASQGVNDSWIFLGDSITAGGMGNSWGTSFATYVNRLDSRFTPIQQNGGIGGILSSHGKNAIDGWLSGSPVKYVSIAFGTNDCWGNPNNVENYYNNTKYMIDAIIKAGKVPVLPTIPSSTNSDVGPNVGYYNAKIKQLYSEYGDKLIQGPDFESFFKENTGYLSSDGVHPSFDGYEEMRRLWSETMYKNVYSKSSGISSLAGDADGNGKLDYEDYLLVKKHLQTGFVLSEEAAKRCDFDKDGAICSSDVCCVKKTITDK